MTKASAFIKNIFEKINDIVNEMLEPVPQGAVYGGVRYAYGVGPNDPMYLYDHPLGEFIVFGPNSNSPNSWQISFFVNDPGKASEWRTFDDAGAEDDIMAVAEEIANDIAQINTVEELDAYFSSKEDFDSV